MSKEPFWRPVESTFVSEMNVRTVAANLPNGCLVKTITSDATGTHSDTTYVPGVCHLIGTQFETINRVLTAARAKAKSSEKTLDSNEPNSNAKEEGEGVRRVLASFGGDVSKDKNSGSKELRKVLGESRQSTLPDEKWEGLLQMSKDS